MTLPAAAVVPLARLAAAALLVGSALAFRPLVPIAEAKPDPRLAGLDLRVRPGDVGPGAGPPLPDASALAPPPAAPFDTPEAVAEADRVPRAEIANRRRGGNGPPIGGDGGLLQELLENKTIPLFRVTVQPPF